MKEFKDAVMERTGHKAKAVGKILAFRVRQETWDALKTEGDQAGVKVSELARAVIEEFCSGL